MNTETQKQNEVPQPPPLTQGRMYVEVEASTPPEVSDLYHVNIRMAGTEESVFPSALNFIAGEWELRSEDYEVINWLKPIN